MDLEIRHLRAICAIAEAGSLSLAAKRLGVSQPAMSAQLRRLERIVDGELFVRGPKGVNPTALGERTLSRARILLSDLEALGGNISRAVDTQAPIRLGSAHMECVATLIELVRAELTDFQVALRVEESAVTLLESLTHDRLDLAVMGTMDDNDLAIPPPLDHRTLVPRLPIFVALSTHHRLAAASQVRLADLASEAWICPPGAEDGSLASLRTACRRAGFEARIRYEMPSGGGRQLIEAGHAVQLVEPTSVGWGGIAIRPLADEPLHARLRLVWRPGRLNPQQLDRVYRAAGRAYATHAVAGSAFGPWWAAHPEVHPFTG